MPRNSCYLDFVCALLSLFFFLSFSLHTTLKSQKRKERKGKHQLLYKLVVFYYLIIGNRICNSYTIIYSKLVLFKFFEWHLRRIWYMINDFWGF